MAAKARPVLVVNVAFLDDERALYAIVPHTTAVRATRFEVPLDIRWLELGAFDAQGIRSVPGNVFIKRLGVITPEQMVMVETALKKWLGMN